MKKHLFTGLIFASLLSIPSAMAASVTYSDVSSDMKYAQAIEFITEEEIVSGYPDGTFRPLNKLNRAEMLKILVESTTKEAIFAKYSDDECFTDVPANEWYTKYVCYAKSQGYVAGDPEGTFRPGDNINLVEALKITLEVLGYEYDEITPPSKLAWYGGIVNSASEKNLIPLDFTSFGQTVTRGQMADLITRTLYYETEQQEEYLQDKTDFVVSYTLLAANANLEKEYKLSNLTVLYSEDIVEQEFENRIYPTVKIWKKTATGEPEVLVDAIGGVGEYPASFFISPDNKKLLINLESRAVLVDIATGKQTNLFKNDLRIESMIFSADGNEILAWAQLSPEGQEYNYAMFKHNLLTEETETLFEGEVFVPHYFLNWFEDIELLTVVEAVGEAAGISKFDLKTGRLNNVIEPAIFIRVSKNGTTAAIGDTTIYDTCLGIFGITPTRYRLMDLISETYPKTWETDGEKVLQFQHFSPNGNEVIMQEYLPYTGDDYDQCDVWETDGPPNARYFKYNKVTGTQMDIASPDEYINYWFPEQPVINYDYTDATGTKLYIDDIDFTFPSYDFQLIGSFYNHD